MSQQLLGPKVLVRMKPDDGADAIMITLPATENIV